MLDDSHHLGGANFALEPTVAKPQRIGWATGECQCLLSSLIKLLQWVKIHQVYLCFINDPIDLNGIVDVSKGLTLETAIEKWG